MTQPKPDSANGKSDIFHITMADLVGRRPTMEDTFSICPNLGGVGGREAFAIFDGHAGRYIIIITIINHYFNVIIVLHPILCRSIWIEY